MTNYLRSRSGEWVPFAEPFTRAHHTFTGRTVEEDDYWDAHADRMRLYGSTMAG